MTVLRPVSRSPEKGAETLVWLATSPDIANVSGRYFFDQEQRPPSPEARRSAANKIGEAVAPGAETETPRPGVTHAADRDAAAKVRLPRNRGVGNIMWWVCKV
jgi:hypothetical protein